MVFFHIVHILKIRAERRILNSNGTQHLRNYSSFVQTVSWQIHFIFIYMSWFESCELPTTNLQAWFLACFKLDMQLILINNNYCRTGSPVVLPLKSDMVSYSHIYLSCPVNVMFQSRFSAVLRGFWSIYL